VVRWFGPPDSARGLLELNRSRWAQGTGATFSICDADDACLGRVWVNLAGSGRGSVGYWLLPEAREKGFRYSFGQVNLAVGAWRPGTRPTLPLHWPPTGNPGEWQNGAALWRKASFGRMPISEADAWTTWSSRCYQQTSTRATRD